MATMTVAFYATMPQQGLGGGGVVQDGAQEGGPGPVAGGACPRAVRRCNHDPSASEVGGQRVVDGHADRGVR
jgi:hypothetical protein